MTRNTIIYSIILFLYALGLIVVAVINNTVYDNNTIMTSVLSIMILFFIIYWIFIIVLSKKYIQKDNEQFNDDFRKKLYKKMIDDQTEKLKTYFEYSMVMNTKFNLLIAYFYKGENEKAIEYLNKNKWYNFRDEVIIFKGLSYLYNKEIDKAEIELNKLRRKGRKDDYDLLNDVLFAVKQNKKTPKVTKLTLPIIREIVKKL